MKLHGAAAAALLLSGCGYIGEPLYPLLNIPKLVDDLTAVQRGAVIVYQFTLPTLTAEEKPAKIGQVEIRAGSSGPGGFNRDTWYANSTKLDAKPNSKGHVRSEIPVATWVGKDVALSVKVYGANGRDGGWSKPVTVAVVPPLSKPSDVKADAVPQGVRVSWVGPAGEYRVLRQDETEKEYRQLGTVTATQYLDTTTEYGKRYSYMIQELQKAGSGYAESELSDGRDLTPVDQFPPAVPSNLNAIAAANHIELVWDRNTEPDLAGYRVFRSVAGGAFEKIADVPEAPSYSDGKVESGKQYRYTVSAVDRAGNESQRSEPVEISPP